MRDIAFNIILQCRPIDVLSLYMVNKTYHQLLKEEYTLKCFMDEQVNDPIKRHPFKYIVNLHLKNHYDQQPKSTAKTLNNYKILTVDLYVHYQTQLSNYPLQHVRNFLTMTGFSSLVSSCQYYTDNYEYWLVNVFEPCINNFLVKKIKRLIK